MPASNQFVQPQPNEASYPIDRLFLMPRLNRAKYLEIFGEQAPPFDPKRPIQRWFFTDIPVEEDAAQEIVQFTAWDEAQRKIRSIVVTKAQARTPNLPGAYSYPKYAPPTATPAKMFGPMGDGTDGYVPVSTEYMVDPVLARTVMDEINRDLGLGLEIQEQPDPHPWRIIWGAETRRILNYAGPGIGPWASAPILRDRFGKGLGSPGKWKGGKNYVAWAPEVQPTGEVSLLPEVPIPCRRLLPNERLEISPFETVVVRTDLATDRPGPGTGSLTVQQDALLREIAAGVRALLSRHSG